MRSTLIFDLSFQNTSVSENAVNIELSKTAQKWATTARQYADEFLQPHEVEAELNDGVIDAAIAKRNKERAIELGFSAIDVPKAHGGLELSMQEQVAIWEQLGRTTNALSWCFSEPQSWMFEACTAEQIDRYVTPMMRGERKDCYAITEAGPGSDVAGIEATAVFDGDTYQLNGEKWYVTSGNIADFFWFQARLPDEDAEALFLVDADTDGIEVIATPKFSHTYAAHHPTYRFTGVRVPAGQRVGRPGDGMNFTRSWFRHERLMIGARSCGAAARLIEDAMAFASQRIVDGAPLSEKQAIQFMLADSATELYASRLMTYDAAAAIDRGDDVKAQHSRCSMVKLYVSEMANRVADRAVQIFGGRGYMRENVAERFFRELRVDRIWEGTSEIQRLIIARSLLKRGLDGM
ncbi:MAG: acyl-CoA/acyl-ACP dehydrogenase [Gammaproteobacteria bacterium]|nr:acyl-CoA/acyl-ACP dehydrogenase [Gammaproteobacteria bacterium]